MPDKPLHEQNRRSWNAATDAHNTHKGDQARFFREGGTTLFGLEREALGELSGRRVVHLQCNAGQDTLSLVRLGPASVTGVDISDTAIDFARRLSADTGLSARFERADVYDFLETTSERFDVAFASYGALCWLSDLPAWGRGVARILAPGGRLVVVEFHPVWMMLDDAWHLADPYMATEALTTEGVSDYVALLEESRGRPPEGVEGFVNPHACHEFAWGLGDVVGAVLGAGLTLTRLTELGHSPYALVPGMRLGEDGYFRPPEGVPELPLVYVLEARRPA